MRTRKILGSLLIGLPLFPACSAAEGEEFQESVASIDHAIAAPSTLGTYCSKTSSNGTWSISTVPNRISPPCLNGATTVRRNGYYSVSGWNSAMVRCNDGAYWVSHGLGDSPIDNVENAARSNNKGSRACIVTVAPREMPIFQTPFDSSPTGLGHGSGFDFARNYPVNTLAMGTGGSPNATMVDHRGRVHSSPPELDGHAGHDWPIAEGEPLRAVADGVVVRRNTFTVPTGGCLDAESLPGYTPNQREIYILHTVETPGIGVSERFISYYAHLSAFQGGVTVGTTVKRGDTIGKAGTTGCSTGSHLHLGVYKLNNTANALAVPLPSTLPYGRDWILSQQPIDPYGWSVTCGNHADCTDPWGHRGFPNGAFSSNLWIGTPPLNTNW